MLGTIFSSRCQISRASRSPMRQELMVHTARNANLLSWTRDPTGGARRDRTDDLLLAKQALSQLSYGPLVSHTARQSKLANKSRLRPSGFAGQSSLASRAKTGGPGKI